MHDHKSPFIQTVFFAGLPLFLLLVIDFFALYLQLESKIIPHFAFAILTAQLLCILVFMKGQICNGQRSRLAQLNGFFAAFWGIWLLLSLFSNYHFALTDVICLLGGGIVIACTSQPQDVKTRKAMLIMASAVGILAILSYLIIFLILPLNAFMSYNIFAQMLVGVILANLYLALSKNRLQGFIALLPLVMLGCLFFNALTSLVLLFLQQSAVIFHNPLALVLYFALHLVIALFLAVFLLKKWALKYTALLMLLFIAASLPIWSLLALM